MWLILVTTIIKGTYMPFLKWKPILKIIHMEGQNKNSWPSYNIVVKMTILMCDYSLNEPKTMSTIAKTINFVTYICVVSF